MKACEDDNSETKMVRVDEQGPKLTISTVTQQPKTEADMPASNYSGGLIKAAMDAAANRERLTTESRPVAGSMSRSL